MKVIKKYVPPSVDEMQHAMSVIRRGLLARNFHVFKALTTAGKLERNIEDIFGVTMKKFGEQSTLEKFFGKKIKEQVYETLYKCISLKMKYLFKKIVHIIRLVCLY